MKECEGGPDGASARPRPTGLPRFAGATPPGPHRVEEGDWAGLTFKGLYDMERIAAAYARLPGISAAAPNFTMGGGPTVCARADGASYHYLFDDASGDCPSGCIDHDYTYFTTAAAGTVTERGRWSSSRDGAGGAGGPRPPWLGVCEPPAPAR